LPIDTLLRFKDVYIPSFELYTGINDCSVASLERWKNEGDVASEAEPS